MYVLTKFLERGISERGTEREMFDENLSRKQCPLFHDVAYCKLSFTTLVISHNGDVRTPPNLI
jgi:hypothetical protein